MFQLLIFIFKSAERVPVSQHPWHLTATLQFDHKKFIICPQTSGDPESAKCVYFTDDYRKFVTEILIKFRSRKQLLIYRSMYFVNFSAGQHRFCMKMRSWAATLPIDSRTNGHSLPRKPANGQTGQYVQQG